MMKRKAPEHLADNKREFWTHHMEGSKKSKVANTTYCEQHGLSIKSYYYWKSKLQLEEESEPLRLVALRRTEELPTPKILDPAPVPIRIYISRFSVDVRPGFDPQNLGNVVRVLEGLSCGK